MYDIVIDLVYRLFLEINESFGLYANFSETEFLEGYSEYTEFLDILNSALGKSDLTSEVLSYDTTFDILD